MRFNSQTIRETGPAFRTGDAGNLIPTVRRGEAKVAQTLADFAAYSRQDPPPCANRHG